MGKVSLNINGRSYGLGCEAGEEERLMRLGQKLDERVAQMASQFGQIGDLRLLVMAGITLLDEMDDPASTADRRLEQEMNALRSEVEATQRAHGELEGDAADALLQAAKRIEGLAARLAEVSSS